MEGNHPIKVSFVRRCHEKDCKTMTLEEVFYAIKSGDHGLKEKITEIRNNYDYEKDVAGHSTENAKKAIAHFKAELPGTLFSGTFSERNNASLVEYSGLLCADLDTLGDKLNDVRESLKDLPYVHAIMLSPSGDGLKVLFNVVPDPARHADSFRAIQKLLRMVGLEIDEKCKDLARICFFTYDPGLWVRTEDNMPIDPLPPEAKAPIIPIANLGERQRIAVEVLGQAIDFDSETHGFLVCPGKHLHTAKDGPRDCQLNLDGAPTLYCFHASCGPVLDGFNKLLRSRIGKVEFVPTPNGKKSVHVPPKEETKEDWFSKIQSSIVLATKADLGSLILKPRVCLLGEWLCESDYGIIFGPRGVAKTWFSLLIANAIATGGDIGEWSAGNAKKVLFIDGEMPADMIRDRLLGFGGSENITLLNHEILFDRTQSVINITSVQQQDALLQLCLQQTFKVLILDNLSVCAFGIKENDSFEWEQLHRWLLQFRRHGIAVILLHHAGKTGQIRGTTKREDAAAWVISLTDAKERSEDKRGSRFISYFAKQSRNCMNTPAYEWHVVLDDGRVEVNWKLAQGADIVLQCIKDGVSECSMIATEMGVSAASVCRLAKKLQDQGKIEIRGRKYVLSLSEACE